MHSNCWHEVSFRPNTDVGSRCARRAGGRAADRSADNARRPAHLPNLGQRRSRGPTAMSPLANEAAFTRLAESNLQRAAAMDEPIAHAAAILSSLAPEGRLQGDAAWQKYSRPRRMCSLDFYIEDAYTRVPGDPRLLKWRVGRASKARVVRSASFCCTDAEIRARYVHLFEVQPFNVFLSIEGVLSYEDLRSESRTPLWGKIALLATPSSLARTFDDACQRKEHALRSDLERRRRSLDARTFFAAPSLPRLPASAT